MPPVFLSFLDYLISLTASPISLNTEVADVEKPQENTLEIPWVSLISCEDMSLRRKEISRERKQKWIFKNTLAHRFDKLVKMCGEKLGTETTVQVFGRLGRETGVKEYNALIGLCIEEARKSQDEEVLSRQLYKAFQLFNSMREGGFELGEETYGPFLIYLIDAQLVEEFHFFYEVIRDGNPNSVPRLGYYEMLLWIRLNNKDKIQELCNFIAVGGGEKSMVHGMFYGTMCRVSCLYVKALFVHIIILEVTCRWILWYVFIVSISMWSHFIYFEIFICQSC